MTAVTEPPSLPGAESEKSLDAASQIDAHEMTARRHRRANREPGRIGRNLAELCLAIAWVHTMLGNIDLERSR